MNIFYPYSIILRYTEPFWCIKKHFEAVLAPFGHLNNSAPLKTIDDGKQPEPFRPISKHFIHFDHFEKKLRGLNFKVWHISIKPGKSLKGPHVEIQSFTTYSK